MTNPERDPDRQPPTREEILRRAGPYMGIGSTFLAAIVTCLLAGWGLDRWLDTMPWFTLAGAFLGIAAGFYMFFKIIQGAGREGPGE